MIRKQKQTKPSLDIVKLEEAIIASDNFLHKRSQKLNEVLGISSTPQILQPLLPLTTNQLAMILVSGGITDGLVKAGNESHLVKGLVYKATQQKTTQNAHGTTTDTILTNEVCVRILNANGSYTDFK